MGAGAGTGAGADADAEELRAAFLRLDLFDDMKAATLPTTLRARPAIFAKGRTGELYCGKSFQR
jgi:hypothetical protein